MYDYVIGYVIVPEQNIITFMSHTFKEELCKFSLAVTFKFFRSTVLSTKFIYLRSDTTCSSVDHYAIRI